MMRPRRALLAAALLAACGPEPSGDAASRPAPDSADAAPAVQPDTVSPGAAGVAIVLAPDGLELAGGAGAPKRLAFGDPQSGVLAQVGAVLGQPGEQGTQEECPAGPLDHALYGAGLQLVFQDSAFVGWSARQGSTLRTAAGIGPGSTLGQLRTAYPAATVEESSLGAEFTAGELSGVVADSSAAGEVEVMFAGTNCIFR